MIDCSKKYSQSKSYGSKMFLLMFFTESYNALTSSYLGTSNCFAPRGITERGPAIMSARLKSPISGRCSGVSSRIVAEQFLVLDIA